MEFVIDIQKRFTDYDIQGIVNHAVACTYVETAYINLMHELDPNWGFWNVPFVISAYEGKHKAGIPPAADVQCRLRVIAVNGASFTLDVKLTDRTHPEKIYLDGKRILAYAPDRHAARMPRTCYEKLLTMLN